MISSNTKDMFHKDSPWCAIRQRCHIHKHRKQNDVEHHDNDRALHPKISELRRFRLCFRPADRYGVVDVFGEDKAQDGTCDEG